MAMAFCILSYLNRIVKNHARTLTLSQLYQYNDKFEKGKRY